MNGFSLLGQDHLEEGEEKETQKNYGKGEKCKP
jgi:hypothetical protein